MVIKIFHLKTEIALICIAFFNLIFTGFNICVYLKLRNYVQGKWVL